MGGCGTKVAPADKPGAEPEAAPAEPPAEEPAEAPADEPADESADKPAEEPADELAEEPAAELVAEPAEAPAEAPADKPGAEPEAAPEDEVGDEPDAELEDENEMWPTALIEAMESTTLIDAAWLDDLAESGGILPRCQDVPASAKVSLSDMAKWTDKYTLPLLVISYPWLGCLHPDAHGEQLRRLAFVLRAFAREAARVDGKVGVFWECVHPEHRVPLPIPLPLSVPALKRSISARAHSYCSLPQRSMQCPDGADDRSPADQERFGRALSGINAWYGNQMSHVLLVNTPLPGGRDYENCQPYDGRGWCIGEMRMSSIVKDYTALIDLSRLSGDETSLTELREKGKAGRPAPMAPDTFGSMLKAGVADGSVKFTNRGDVALVSRIYEAAFLVEMRSSSALYYVDLGWGDAQAAELARALLFAHAKGSLSKLEEFILGGNRIGDQGMIALSDSLACGAMARCSSIELSGNPASEEAKQSVQLALKSRWLDGDFLAENLSDVRVLNCSGLGWGDAEMTKLAAALEHCHAIGALANLKKLWLDNNQIGDAGCTALANAAGRGAMANLSLLQLAGNPASEAAQEEAQAAILNR